MPLFRDSSNGRIYLIEVNSVKWLTNDQYIALQQPYVNITNAALGIVCGAYNVPINLLPTSPGSGWYYATQANQGQTSIAVTHKNEIIAKISETHQG